MTPFFQASRRSLAYQFTVNAPLLCPLFSIFRKLLHFQPCSGQNFSSLDPNFSKFSFPRPQFLKEKPLPRPYILKPAWHTSTKKKVECPPPGFNNVRGENFTMSLEHIYQCSWSIFKQCPWGVFNNVRGAYLTMSVKHNNVREAYLTMLMEHVQQYAWKFKGWSCSFVSYVHISMSALVASRLRHFLSPSSIALFVATPGRCFRHSFNTDLPRSCKSVSPYSAFSTITSVMSSSTYRSFKSFRNTTSVTSLISRSEILAVNVQIIDLNWQL